MRPQGDAAAHENHPALNALRPLFRALSPFGQIVRPLLVKLTWNLTGHEVLRSECNRTVMPLRIDMSGKNFRVQHTGKRTNIEGKHVTNKVLLATPDNEYQMIRDALTYV